MLLCNDRAVLGPWVNKTWLNVVAATIVGLLVVLSLILATTTRFPTSDATKLAAGLGILLVVALVVIGAVSLAQRRHRGPDQKLAALARMEKETWRMPPLQELTKPVWSTTHKVGMFTLRGYLILAVILLAVKIFQLAIGGTREEKDEEEKKMEHKEQARRRQPNPIRERLIRWANDSPRGEAVARWIGKVTGTLEFRLRLGSVDQIPWTPYIARSPKQRSPS